MAEITLSLIDHLQAVSADWGKAHDDAPLSRLGRLAVNDGGFFTRLDRPVTTATLEKFARFLSEAANWPEGVVPVSAEAFAGRVFGAMAV